MTLTPIQFQIQYDNSLYVIILASTNYLRHRPLIKLGMNSELLTSLQGLIVKSL